jgi:hypothetical protein
LTFHLLLKVLPSMGILAEMSKAEAAGLWSGLLIILLGLLAFRVTWLRLKTSAEAETGTGSQFDLASQVLSNATEYIPVSVGALILVYHLELPVMAIHGLGAALLAGRVVQAAGLSKPGTPAIMFAGMALTFLAIFAAGGMLVLNALLPVVL